MKTISNTPPSDPQRWSRVHIEGDNRAPVGMIAVPRPSLVARVWGWR